MKEKIEVIEEVEKSIMSFSEQNLTHEEEEICLHIWKKLARKRKLDISRTRPDIWAAAVIWSFCRANFKYEEGLTLEVLCRHFKNKKSSVGNKAGEIIKILQLDYFSPEFSTRKIQEQNPLNTLVLTDSGLIVPEELGNAGKKYDSKWKQAEETLDEGLERLEGGDEEEAVRSFFKSIEIDPAYGDGYNHLANIAWRKGDWKQAESLYRKALELAEPEVKDVPRGNFWGIVESRPYMRAIYGLGLTAWKQGWLEEAIGIFEKMLKLNCNDNQGVRYLVGPVYHQIGDLNKAAEWYEKNADDPRNLYNYGLLLIQKDELEMAARKLIAAIFENPYIAPILLKDKLPENDWELGTGRAEPEYAEDYVNEYRTWWEQEEPALNFLRAIWGHGELQRNLRDFNALQTAVNSSENEEYRLNIRRAIDGFIRPEKVQKLAGKIYNEFIKDKAEQKKLL